MISSKTSFVLIITIYVTSAELSSPVAVSQPDIDYLTFVAILHRHGDRTPNQVYPTDPYNDYPWIGGRAALTPKGSYQLFNMGMHLRFRYVDLLPSDSIYSQDNMRAVSSNPQRCVMSGQCLLAGLMPPNQSVNPLPIQWQPAAVIALPKDSDYLLYQAGVPCPKYDAMYAELLTNPNPQTEFYQYNQQCTDLYAYLSECTGENVTNVEQVSELSDILTVEYNEGLTLPEWTRPVFPVILNNVRVRAMQLYTETPYMTRVRGGPLIEDIFSQMVQKIKGELSRNCSIYSAHDTTLNFVMTALGVINETAQLPDYGATLCFEMRCKQIIDFDNCDLQIVYYFNTTQITPTVLTVPNCPAPCSVRRFGIVTSHIRVHNFTKECE